MGKHRVKNDPSPPKNDPSPPHRSDPSNEEYITVPKKVTFDSLVEFSPQELNSCRHRALIVGAGRAAKKKEAKKGRVVYKYVFGLLYEVFPIFIDKILQVPSVDGQEER